ncbi:bactofilin family protein [Texcoconibacillus texcoconensis]|uniref:Cytoskeletal protein CcmA (Bactofilin family) n=1 Tax=Texcoconibacillus texcoconensis TaxID=1095777 RepID=A0A840QPL6_9BACI|nr:polymer-forming cytoskeletal protein [Texcoconibacillus texcoconensis]MBB5173310.1 cytoskeletal protein CcmA (bactofilin family) [Texcoconibacillus texcoconensis]
MKTVIGKGTTIEGTVHIDSSIRIDGNVYGEVKSSGDVTVGSEGYVEHDIFARNIHIAGKVKGNVDGEEKVHLLDSGYLEGSATMDKLVIDENAHFHGQSFMKKNEKHSPQVIDGDMFTVHEGEKEQAQ